MLIKDAGICIRVVDYSETSQVVTFFTRGTGKVTAIAKGSKRPKSAFDGPIEILAHGQLVLSDAGREKIATLTEFEQQNNPFGSDLFVLNCCLFAAELLDRLTDEYDPHPRLFDESLRFLNDIGRLPDKSASLLLLIRFQLALLREAGLQPVLGSCANCRADFTASWPQTYFSSTANGFICRDCEASFPDKISLSKAAAGLLNKPGLTAKIGHQTFREVEKILIAHFTEILGRKPKMAKHILAD